MKTINKSAKAASPSTLIALVAIVALLVVGGLFYKTSGTASVSGPAQAPSQSGAASCAYAPTVTISGTDALVASTTATPTTVNYIVNGKYLGTSAPAVTSGDVWTIVGDLNGYLADQQTLTVACGANKIVATPYAYANATVTIKDDLVSSSNTLTNGGGANNATAAAAGSSRNFPVIIQGTSQKSTGKLFWIIESPASSQSNISTMAVTCNGAQLPNVAIPNGASATNSGSSRIAVEVPAVVGASQTNCNLQIVNSATGTVKGTVLNTFYAEQTFVDADGKVQTGIYDSSSNGNNAAKYQDKYTYNIVIQ